MTSVVVRGGAGLTQEIQARGHTLRADEPIEDGGTDAGMGPYELLLAALGACTAMTVRLYADRKGWPLEAVEVSLTHQSLRAEGPSTSATEPPRDRVVKQLTLRGPLDAAQRRRLAEIADRCPVRRTLGRAVTIEQQLLPEA